MIALASLALGACSSGGADEGGTAITEKPANFNKTEGGVANAPAAESAPRPGAAPPEGM